MIGWIILAFIILLTSKILLKQKIINKKELIKEIYLMFLLGITIIIITEAIITPVLIQKAKIDIKCEVIDNKVTFYFNNKADFAGEEFYMKIYDDSLTLNEFDTVVDELCQVSTMVAKLSTSPEKLSTVGIQIYCEYLPPKTEKYLKLNNLKMNKEFKVRYWAKNTKVGEYYTNKFKCN